MADRIELFTLVGLAFIAAAIALRALPTDRPTVLLKVE